MPHRLPGKVRKNMLTSSAVLTEQPFLKNLTPEQFEKLAGCAFNVHFDEGQFVFREGEAANHFYILTGGKVALEMFAPGRGPITIETLGSNDVLGWSWLFPPFRWHFDGRAVEATDAVAFDAKCLRAICDEDHDVGYELSRQFAHIIMERLQSTRYRLLDLYGASH